MPEEKIPFIAVEAESKMILAHCVANAQMARELRCAVQRTRMIATIVILIADQMGEEVQRRQESRRKVFSIHSVYPVCQLK